MSDDQLRKALSYRWVIFWLLALGYVLVYFHRLCPAVLALDMVRDLHLSARETGFLGAAYFYPYALMQLPAGLLSDSWGPRRTITLFFSVATVGSILLGLAPGFGVAVLGRTLVGVGVAMLFVPTMKILAEWFRVREFATMTGILMAMGGIGSLSAQTPLAALSSAIGWRYSLIAVGLFTAVVTVFIWTLVRDRPAQLGWPSPTEHVKSGAPAIPLRQAVRRVLSRVSFWPLAIWFFFECAVFFSFVGLWGGPYLQHIFGYTKVEAGQVLSMAAIGMVVGSPTLSVLSNRVFGARKPVIVLCAFLTLLLTALLAFATDGIPPWGRYALCFGLGVSSSAVVVIGFTMAKEFFPVQMAGTATGLVNLFPFAGGAVFQPVLGAVLGRHRTEIADGAVYTAAEYHEAFLVLFACAAAALVASFFLSESLRKSHPEEPVKTNF